MWVETVRDASEVLQEPLDSCDWRHKKQLRFPTSVVTPPLLGRISRQKQGIRRRIAEIPLFARPALFFANCDMSDTRPASTPRWLDISPSLKTLRRDPALRPVIRRVAERRIRLNPRRFETLAHSILSQQISTAAARSIRAKLIAAAGGLSAARLSRLTDPQLRACGVSPQKIGYLRDLIEKTVDRRLKFRSYTQWEDERVIEDLVRVRGIGRWTAQMFLIFSLGRLDVLPVDDLGVRSAVKTLYSLAELPSAGQLGEIAHSWRPYASVASWYCWRSLSQPT